MARMIRATRQPAFPSPRSRRLLRMGNPPVATILLDRLEEPVEMRVRGDGAGRAHRRGVGLRLRRAAAPRPEDEAGGARGGGAPDVATMRLMRSSSRPSGERKTTTSPRFGSLANGVRYGVTTI